MKARIGRIAGPVLSHALQVAAAVHSTKQNKQQDVHKEGPLCKQDGLWTTDRYMLMRACRMGLSKGTNSQEQGTAVRHRHQGVDGTIHNAQGAHRCSSRWGSMLQEESYAFRRIVVPVQHHRRCPSQTVSGTARYRRSHPTGDTQGHTADTRCSAVGLSSNAAWWSNAPLMIQTTASRSLSQTTKAFQQGGIETKRLLEPNSQSLHDHLAGNPIPLGMHKATLLNVVVQQWGCQARRH